MSEVHRVPDEARAAAAGKKRAEDEAKNEEEGENKLPKREGTADTSNRI